MSEKKEYNQTLVALWENEENGSFKSMKVDKVAFDNFQKIEEGGLIVIKKLREESRKSDTSPTHYLEFVSPAKLAAFKANRQPRKAAADEDSL